jgi:hypothetical protein
MSTIELVEQQIRELSGREFSELRDWVLDHDWQGWEVQIEADSQSGKLDKLSSEAQADYTAGGYDLFEACHVRQVLGALRIMPVDIRAAAHKQFALLKIDSRYPSLHFKKVGSL